MPAHVPGVGAAARPRARDAARGGSKGERRSIARMEVRTTRHDHTHVRSKLQYNNAAYFASLNSSRDQRANIGALWSILILGTFACISRERAQPRSSLTRPNECRQTGQ